MLHEAPETRRNLGKMAIKETVKEFGRDCRSFLEKSTCRKIDSDLRFRTEILSKRFATRTGFISLKTFIALLSYGGFFMHTLEQVAKLFGVGKHKVIRWIDDGELEAVDVSNPETIRRQPRISDEAIEAFKRRRSTLNRDANSLPAVEAIV